MAALTKFNLGLSPAQIKKASDGKKIRLTHAQLKSGGVPVHLKPRNAQRIETRLAKGVGCDLQLIHGESVGSTEGGSLMGSIKSFHAKSKPQIRGFLHRQVNALAPRAQQAVESAATPYLGSNASRRISSALAPAAHNAVNLLGDKTGAWGLRKSKPCRCPPRFKKGSQEAKDHMAKLRAMRGGKINWKKVGRDVGRVVKPMIRPALKSAATAALSSLGQPEAAVPASMAIDALGDVAGFGVKGGRRRGGSFKAI